MTGRRSTTTAWSRLALELGQVVADAGGAWLTLRAYEPGDEVPDGIARPAHVTTADGRCTVIVDPVSDGRERFAEAMRHLPPGVTVDEKAVTAVLYEPADVEPDLVLVLGPPTRLPPSLVWELAYSELVFEPVTLADLAARAPPGRGRGVPRPPPALRRAGRRERAHLYRDVGVVLRTYKLGEADRIVVLLTAENGKVRAVAKGVRKTMSKFGARLEPMSHVRLLLYRGRELDIVSQAESVEPLAPLLASLDRASQGMAVLEAADQLAMEREPAPNLYRMLVGVLRTIAERPAPLVVPAFYWKLLAAEGLRPELDACVRCGESEPETALVAFDLQEGGVLCRACRSGQAISPAALTLLRGILGGALNAALDGARVAGDPRGRRPRHPRPRAPPRTPPARRRHVRTSLIGRGHEAAQPGDRVDRRRRGRARGCRARPRRRTSRRRPWPRDRPSPWCDRRTP